MNIALHCVDNLKQLQKIIENLTDEQYAHPQEILSCSSIGAHVRHILEFYICLIRADKIQISYDTRDRNKRLEEEKSYCLQMIPAIISTLETYKTDQEFLLFSNFSEKSDEVIKLKTSLFRELAYCLEHSVHHEAIIKIAIQPFSNEVGMMETFGVAASTVRFNTN
jgi:uncharacterized damage-inducible protein DinB